MKDNEKTKEQLIEELAALRQSLSRLEKLALKQQAEETLQQQTHFRLSQNKESASVMRLGLCSIVFSC